MDEARRLEIIQQITVDFYQNLFPSWNSIDEIRSKGRVWVKDIKNKFNDSKIENYALNILLEASFGFNSSTNHQQNRKKWKALIMKGGGIKGLAYVGALEELNKHLNFNWYAGTSAGAIAAILLAADYSTSELKNILQTKNFADFKDANFFKSISNLIFKKGLYEAHSFTLWLDQLLAKKLDSPVDVLLGDLPNRTTVYASRRGKKVVVFDSEDLANKDIRAAFSARCSMSIPVFFTPQSIQGIPTVDGGVQNNYPVNALLEKNPNTNFIGLYLGSKTFEGVKKKNIFRELFSIWQESNDIDALRKYKDQTIIIDPRPISTLQFSLTKEEKDYLLDSGNLAAKEFLIKKNIVSKNYYKEEDLKFQADRITNVKKFLVKKKKNRKLKRKTIGWLIALTLITLLYFRYFHTKNDNLISEIKNQIEMELVDVEGGSFIMGNKNGMDNAKLEHLVSVSSFSIGRYEVTNKEYANFMNEYSANNKDEFIQPHKWGIIYDEKSNKWISQSGYENYPIINVSWDGANEYCKFKNCRLPTEGEWEYAAKGGKHSKKYKYSGSNDPYKVAWFKRNSGDKTWIVGRHQNEGSNELGLYDMTGNVWEWCMDNYDKDYYYSSPSSNPINKNNGVIKVHRGGSYANDFEEPDGTDYIAVYTRSGSHRDMKSPHIGFRCACD